MIPTSQGRKPISISTAVIPLSADDSSVYDIQYTVLCDDGSIWIKDHGDYTWINLDSRMPSEIQPWATHTGPRP